MNDSSQIILASDLTLRISLHDSQGTAVMVQFDRAQARALGEDLVRFAASGTKSALRTTRTVRAAIRLVDDAERVRQFNQLRRPRP